MRYEVSEAIKDFYDKASVQKIRDFVYGNARVDKAWSTIKRHIQSPENILEIGCGIGAICNRCNVEWPNAKIIGIDISERSIEIAKKLFETKNCKYYTSLPEEHDNSRKFDLIMLIDVLEHVEKSQRHELIDFIEKNLSKDGILLLAFPTPHMLNINRTHYPEKLQPVEEDIYITDLIQISQSIQQPLVLYKEVLVWEKRDYGHAIFASQLIEVIEKKPSLRGQLKNRMVAAFRKKNKISAVQERRQMVVDKLHIDVAAL